VPAAMASRSARSISAVVRTSMPIPLTEAPLHEAYFCFLHSAILMTARRLS
jgi:hypothetical protein